MTIANEGDFPHPEHPMSIWEWLLYAAYEADPAAGFFFIAGEWCRIRHTPEFPTSPGTAGEEERAQCRRYVKQVWQGA